MIVSRKAEELSAGTEFPGAERGPETKGARGGRTLKILPLSSPEAPLESQSQFLLR